MLDIFFKAGLKDTAEGFLPAKEKHRISCPTGFFTENTKGMEKGKEAVFEQTASNLVICDDFANPKAEIDLFMTNGDYLLLVETKYRLDNKHVEQIPHKIAMLKKHLPKAVAGKKILTAFASLGCAKSVKEFLTENGHFVFTQKDEQIHTAYPVNF